MAFVPGSHVLVVGSNYGSVALVDVDRGTVVKRLVGHARDQTYRGKTTANPIWTPGMSADGRLLATSSSDGELRFWSLPDGRRLGAPLRFRYGNADGQLSPDGRWLSVIPGTRDITQDRLEIWDVRSRRRTATLRPPAGAAGAARFSPDGRRLAVTDARGRVQLYLDHDLEAGDGTAHRRQGGLDGVQPEQPDARLRHRRRHRPALGRRDGASARCSAPRAARLAVRPDVHPRRYPPDRRAVQRSRLPLGPQARIARQTRLRRCRPPPDPLGMGGLPPRPDLRPGVLNHR